MFDETYYAKDALVAAALRLRAQLGRRAPTTRSSPATPTSGPAAGQGRARVRRPPAGRQVGHRDRRAALRADPVRLAVRAGACSARIAVLVLCRIARRMFRSTLLGCIAGLLLAVDGLALVMSRTALLDGILTCVRRCSRSAAWSLDRDWGRRRIADARRRRANSATPPGDRRPDRGPTGRGCGGGRGASPPACSSASRSARSGTACSSSPRSSLMVAVLGLRRAQGDRRPALPRRPRCGSTCGRCVLALVVLPVVVYVASWTGWIVHWGEHGRLLPQLGGRPRPGDDARASASTCRSCPTGSAASGTTTHEAYRFHKNLDSPHPYQSNPWGWLLLARPVAVYYESVKTGAPARAATARARSPRSATR